MKEKIPVLTDFEVKVYKACQKIPKGKVTTYKAIAEAIGTRAYRAVGQAPNKNPFAPGVPCHRVVASSGHLQGFAQGLTRKATLLRKEKIPISKNNTIQLSKYFYRFID